MFFKCHSLSLQSNEKSQAIASWRFHKVCPKECLNNDYVHLSLPSRGQIVTLPVYRGQWDDSLEQIGPCDTRVFFSTFLHVFGVLILDFLPTITSVAAVIKTWHSHTTKKMKPFVFLDKNGHDFFMPVSIILGLMFFPDSVHRHGSQETRSLKEVFGFFN